MGFENVLQDSLTERVSIEMKIELCKLKLLLFIFMFVPCINSIKTLFYYYKLMHNRLVRRHDIDHVSNDEHIESYL